MEGNLGLGHLGGGTAKGTVPREGHGGKAHLKEKVPGTAGTSAPPCLQEGSREPEDAVL